MSHKCNSGGFSSLQQDKSRGNTPCMSSRGTRRQADTESRDRPTEWHHCRESGTKREESWRAGTPDGRVPLAGLQLQHGHRACYQPQWAGGILCSRSIQPSFIIYNASWTITGREDACANTKMRLWGYNKQGGFIYLFIYFYYLLINTFVRLPRLNNRWMQSFFPPTPLHA